jgi:hypothetical protein
MKIILFSILLLGTLAQNGPDMIIEFFRHGARGPESDYDKSWPTNTFTKLTPVGMRQHYILGKVLSEKYPDIFGSTYNYSQIYVLTDSNPRCIQSAVSHVFGLYDGAGPALPNNYPPDLAIPPYQDSLVDQIANSLPDSEALPHKFIPGIIEIDNKTNNVIFFGCRDSYCPNQKIWEAENIVDLKTAEALVTFKDTLTEANKYLNTSLFNPVNLGDFCDTLPVDMYANKFIGNITDPILIDKLGWACTWLVTHIKGGQETQVQTAAFHLMDTILTQLDSFRQGLNPNKAVIYSGHDDTLYPILAAFGVINEQCVLDNFHSSTDNGTVKYPSCVYPDFASNIIVEFYNSTETPYVQAYYNNVLIPICGGTNCSYADFITFARSAAGNLTEETYQQKCGVKESLLKRLVSTIFVEEQEGSFMPQESPVTVEMFLVILLSMMCAVFMVKIVVNKKKHNQEIQAIRAEKMIY